MEDGRQWHNAMGEAAIRRHRRRDRGAGGRDRVTETAPTRRGIIDLAMETASTRQGDCQQHCRKRQQGQSMKGGVANLGGRGRRKALVAPFGPVAMVGEEERSGGGGGQ